MAETTACSACGADEQPQGARFCFSCGAPLATAVCQQCGTELVPGARFCSGCGAPQVGAASAPPRPAADGPVVARRVTSVLFGDLVGFTSLSETLDEEDVRDLLSRYFDRCRQVVGRYGGTIEKFVGDAVMAVWGVPTAHEDDAERAVRAGLELVQAVTAMGEDLAVGDLAMRVGIVTGQVAVTVGAEHEGMVAGDPVNTASRVQSVAEPGQVWVDETTRLLTSSAITYVDVGSHRLRGKADPMPLWSVRAVVAAVGGSQRADGLEAPLVGRDRELRLVKELFHSVEESGRPALLVVDGEAGVGKTRLGWEFEKYVDGLTEPVRWHAGRCIAYGEGVAYFALAEALRGRLRALDDEQPEDDAVALLQTGLLRYVPAEQERDWLRPRLGALLGAESVATFAKEDLFSAWVTFLERIGEDRCPVVLVIDDAQHADEGLLQFVEHLLTVGTFPCFVVLLTRPGLLESHPGLATNRRGTVMHLPALSDRDVSALLGGLLAGLPDDVRETLVERSEGVPLFAVETVRSLIDRDLVVPRGGQYVLADAAALDLTTIGAPASLQALISARLDTLAPDQRTVVDRASVVGNAFSREVIAGLCEDVDDLDAVLSGLVRLQIFDQQSSRLSAEYGQYHFVQSVVRQVAYGTLSRRDRKASHLAAARQIEAVGDEAGDLAPIIAQHYLDAADALPDAPDVDDLTRSGSEHLRRAARRAHALGAPAEAAAHLEAALARTREPEICARLHSELAAALNDAGRFEDAVTQAQLGQELFIDLGDRVSAGLAAAHRANATGPGLGDHEAAIELAETWWTELRGRPDATQTLLALSAVLISSKLRVSQDFRDLLEARLNLAERAGDVQAIADCFVGLGLHYSNVGSPTLGLALLEKGAELARDRHLSVSLGRALVNLTATHLGDDLAKAVELGREAVSVTGSTGIAGWISFAEANLLVATYWRGRWEEARALLDSIEIDDSINLTVRASIDSALRMAVGLACDLPWTPGDRTLSDDPASIAWQDYAEALLRRQRGEVAAALELAVRACEAVLAVSGVWDDFPTFWQLAGELGLDSGAESTLDRLLEMVDSAQSRLPLVVLAHRARLGALRAMRSDQPASEVETLFGRAVSHYEEYGSDVLVARTRADLARWLEGQGRSDEAREHLDAARTTYVELGATAWLAELGDQEWRTRSSPHASVAPGAAT